MLRILSLSNNHRLARAWAKRIASDVGGEWTEFSYDEERADVVAESFVIEVKVRQNIPEYVKEAILLDKTIDVPVPEYLKKWVDQAQRYEAFYQKPCFICWCEKGHGLRNVVVIASCRVPHCIRWGGVYLTDYQHGF
jgi:hypothetical protein